jgi:hypothetical protein
VRLHLRSDNNQYEHVSDHLRCRPEQVAFLHGTTDAGASDELDIVIKIDDVLALQAHDLELGEWCVQLTEQAQHAVLSWASSGDGWLIEAHSHLGPLADPARFSPTDLAGLAEWVPHVRWRLSRRPYAALVFGPTTFDGVGWHRDLRDAPAPVGSWATSSDQILATMRSVHDMENHDA